MRFSEAWLREWVRPPCDTKALADQLTMAGLEVDAIEPAAPRFEGVVVGRVVSVKPHPGASRLKICQVQAHVDQELLQIVCGADNVYPGMLSAAALAGAVLPNGQTIGESKLYHELSQGMLCSAQELGLSDQSAGILDLPQDAPCGMCLWDYLMLEDAIIEVDFTPNRGDCLSLRGLAREVAVLNNIQVSSPAIVPVKPIIADEYKIEIQDSQACPVYLGRIIRNVDMSKRTPVWMVERLRRSGVRSVDPIVDVTNYVLLELGQPMHAFDLDRLQGAVQVRFARSGESLTLLDGNDVTLTEDTLVIADAAGPLALAGVMGGKSSAISRSTHSVFLECACFNPVTIAGKARAYGLTTDSAYRFERGVDFQLQAEAVERATALLLNIMGGEAGPITRCENPSALPSREPIALTSEQIERVLGFRLEADFIERILKQLGMRVEAGQTGWQVMPPSFRYDINRAEDLIEELARIHGYNNLPVRTPCFSLNPSSLLSEQKQDTGRVKTLLMDLGYQEVITYSFVDPKWQSALIPDQLPLRLQNPIAADMGDMRMTLWTGLLKACDYNLKRQSETVRIFETGLCFTFEQLRWVQSERIAGLWTGLRRPSGWHASDEEADFFAIKGDVETLLHRLTDRSEFEFLPERHTALHPGQCVRISDQGQPIGWVGRIHPEVAKKLGLPDKVFVFELGLNQILERRLPVFKNLSRFPEIKRDIALVLPVETPAGEVTKAIATWAGIRLKAVNLFDVYQGQGVPSGHKSLALSLTFQHPERTLHDEEVNGFMDQVITGAREQFGALLRK